MSRRDQLSCGAANTWIRPADPGDRTLVARFLNDLSTASRYQRHFEHGTAPDEELLRRLDAVNFRDSQQLVAVCKPGGRETVVAHAECVRVDTAAEIALVVADPWQGRGLGALLMKQLELWARGRELERIYGEVMATNAAMLALARRCGFGVGRGADARVLIIRKNLDIPVCAATGWRGERTREMNALPA